MDEKIEIILNLDANPSTKLGLIALAITGEPMTTKELNNVLNVKKTLDNYKILFAEELQTGLVEIFPLKSKSGITRLHFNLNTDKLIEK